MLCAFCFGIKEANMKKLKVNLTTIPNEAILDKRLDTYEFRVLCYLCKLSNEENICFPSYSTIAANMKISRSKTANIINRLIDLGYIEKENRTRGRGGKGSNLYTVCQEYYEDKKQSAEKTTDSILKGHRDGLPEKPDSMQDGLYKYSNKNIKDFINNQSSSIERLMDQAETYNLEGQLKIDFKKALERMYRQKYIKVYGEKIPQELVRERLKNISYEHIACADNRLPREKVNGIWQKKNIDTVPYLISVLYDLLKHNEEELIKIEYGDIASESSSGKEDSDELSI